jgi:hypothetical protein
MPPSPSEPPSPDYDAGKGRPLHPGTNSYFFKNT